MNNMERIEVNLLPSDDYPIKQMANLDFDIQGLDFVGKMGLPYRSKRALKLVEKS